MNSRNKWFSSYLFLILVVLSTSQSQVTITQPPYIETSTFLFRNIATGLKSQTYNITFIDKYPDPPQVLIALASFYTFVPNIKYNLIPLIVEVTNTSSTISFTSTCIVSCNITKINLIYMSYDPATYPFIELSTILITIDNSLSLTNQIYRIAYLNPLSSN